MTYTNNPNFRRADLDKKALARKSPFRVFAKEMLEKYNSGLISADEYYKSVADAKLLLS